MSKKVAKTPKEFHQYDTGDPVLGKVRGYPPWPGVVVDPGDVPPAVISEQPPGKKATFYCILFFPMGDYAWLHPKDLSSLKKHEIEAFLADDSKKRNGDLRAGYEIALNPQPWMTNRATAAQARLEEEENAQVDQLESENDLDAAGDEDSASTKKPKAASKKRKRESEAAESAKAPKKTPKAKKGSAEPAKKKATSTAGRGKKNGLKSKAVVESEDEGEAAEADEGEDAGPSKKTSPPPAKKAKRDKDDNASKVSDDPQSMKVRDWRHKIQKTFLSPKVEPKAEDMDEFDTLFTTIENYDEMTIEQLQFSKIGKVMRHIAALEPDKYPPRDEEFRFRARAKGLVDRWHQILNAKKPAGGRGGDTSPTSVIGHANGKANNKEKDDGEDAVTEGTKGLDLNGTGEEDASPALGIAAAYTAAAAASAQEDNQGLEQDAVAELDADADVTMEEA